MNRSEQLSRIAESDGDWDVIIIGGGASGLGAAVDGASRGYRTVLLEQADFAEGTSSKSTKLIHGGVRYLRSGELGLVRESLRERGRLLRNAPELVEPLAFVVPAYRWYERFLYGAGLTIYDLLAGRRGIASTGYLSADQVAGKIPNLRQTGLYGGTLYWDGQFDDARLAIALAATAVSAGAVVVNHLKVEELVREKGRISGVVARDQLEGTEFRLRGRVVINATGVFTDSVRRMDDPGVSEVIRPSQGVHLVLDRRFLGGDTAVMIPNTEDGRVLFAIPWKNRMILGTTDTDHIPIELHPKPLEEEVDYLIRHAELYFSEAPTHDDIKATFAGLRPLVSQPRAKNGSTARLSRSHSLFVSDSGLVTITGGKWTTYRQMAEDTVDFAARVGNLPVVPCVTGELTLLNETPGKRGTPLDPELPYTMEDVEQAVVGEMAMTLDDVLSRRTRARFLDEAATFRCARTVAGRMASLLGKDEQWVEDQLSGFGVQSRA